MSTGDDIEVGQCWVRTLCGGTARIMAIAKKDKYVMARFKGCIPFVVSFDELQKKYIHNPMKKTTNNNNP